MAKSVKKKSAPKVSKADKEAAKAELERLKNTREYPELIGMLTVVPWKTIATVDWLNDHLPAGEAPIAKVLKKERDRFVLATVRSGTAVKVIDELRDAPARQWKTLFAELAGAPQKKAEEKLKALKPKDFVLFCETNAIPLVRSGAKSTVSKPKTLPHAIAKLLAMKEYLKL